MDPTQLYAAAAGGLMSLLLILSMIRQVQQRIMCLARLARHLGHLFQWPVYFFLKHFVYSFIVRRTRFSGPFSRSALVTQVIYWAGTAVCNSFRVTTAAAAGTRAGELAAVNFAVLLLGGKFEFLADLLGVRANSYRQVHQTVSLMTCLQSLIHILLNTRHGISLGNPLYLFGLLVSSSKSGICQSLIFRQASAGMASLLVTAVLKRLWYGVLAKLHFLLGLFTLVVLWRHLQVKKAPSQLYLLIGSVLLFCSTVIQWFLFALRNVSTSGIGCKSRILRSNDGSAAQIIIPLFRHFKVRAGMNVYLWLPGLGYGSTIQKHPFPIAWWEEDERGLAKTIILLVKTGPGNTILSHDSRLTSFIQGPYGRAIDFAGYDRVLMVATGMGIAAQLPYLKELVMMKDKKRTTRQLYVVWQLEEECESGHQFSR